MKKLKILIEDYKSLRPDIREILETLPFPGSITPEGYPTEVAFFGLDVGGKQKQDLIETRMAGFRRGSENPLYYETIRAMCKARVWWIPEFPIPICQRAYYRSLGGTPPKENELSSRFPDRPKDYH